MHGLEALNASAKPLPGASAVKHQLYQLAGTVSRLTWEIEESERDIRRGVPGGYLRKSNAEAAAILWLSETVR